MKSAGGERLRTLDVAPAGAAGDRIWAVADADGTLVSAKHPRLGGPLLQVACRYDDESGLTTLDVPRVGEVTAGTGEADAALSCWLGRPVRLTSTPAPKQRLRRWWPSVPDLVPDWESRALPGDDAVTRIAGTDLRKSFVDYGALHLVTAEDLRQLSATCGADVDPVRFRPNLLIDGVGRLDDSAHRLRIGPALIDIELATPRCAVPGLSPMDSTLDSSLLRNLARFDRRQVGKLGRAACFGVYAVPTSNATITAGEDVALA